MGPRSTSAVIVATLLLLGTSGVAQAADGAAGTGSPAAVQYQPETTGEVPVVPDTSTPPETPPATTPPVAVPASAPSVSTTPTTTAASAPDTSKPPATAKRTAQSAPDKAVVVPVAQTTPTEPQAATLPFTGYDVVPVALAGILLLAFGFVVRRRTRHSGN